MEGRMPESCRLTLIWGYPWLCTCNNIDFNLQLCVWDLCNLDLGPLYNLRSEVYGVSGAYILIGVGGVEGQMKIKNVWN